MVRAEELTTQSYTRDEVHTHSAEYPDRGPEAVAAVHPQTLNPSTFAEGPELLIPELFVGIQDAAEIIATS